MRTTLFLQGLKAGFTELFPNFHLIFTDKTIMVDMSYEGKGTSTAGVQKKFVITHRSVTKLDKTF